MLNSAATQRQPWVIGNWKMNGGLSENEALLSDLLGLLESHGGRPIARCAVAVPAPYLFQTMVRLSGHPIGWGAQDVSAEVAGAFTGEVAVSMLQDFEAQFSLVGHSERRSRHGETDALVAAKALALVQQGLTPVVCVGESLQERDQGRALTFVCDQVRQAAQPLHAQGVLADAAFAYEPIWAIGTGEVHPRSRRRRFMRRFVARWLRLMPQRPSRSGCFMVAVSKRQPPPVWLRSRMWMARLSVAHH